MDALAVSGKRVLVREDFNVPLKDADIADYRRIDAALPTLRELLERSARVIVVSHLGRPDGKPNPKYTLQPIAGALSQRLGIGVTFAKDVVGESAHAAVDGMRDGDVVLLENVRFEPGEERDDPSFARKLAELADMYVDDAFGTAHRAHASTEGVAHFLPSAAGLLMEKEIRELSKLVDNPAKPYVCAIGGAKIADKIGVFENLSNHVTTFCVGGGMAKAFLAAMGVDVGRSLRDDDLSTARQAAQTIASHGAQLLLPVDAVASRSFDDESGAHVVDLGGVGNEMILDIGPATAQTYAAAIETAQTVVFNGPMGVYEKAAYRSGTRVVGEAMAKATARGATTIVGGGDAAAAAEELGFAEKVTHVSTGGGATLEFLEGKTLPGIAVLCSTN